MKHDILFELGTEELPSRLLKPLAKNLLECVLQYLNEAQLPYGAARYMAGPRRIGFLIHDVAARQENRLHIRRGPAVSTTDDANASPSKALLGFARSCGVALDALTVETNEKGQWWIYQVEQAGKTTSSLLPEMIKQALAAVNIPKPMRWGAETFTFARPVHWAVLMYDDQVLATELFGINTHNISYGHRFHHPHAVLITSVQAYEASLFAAKVMVDFDERRQAILRQISAIASEQQFDIPCPDDLLDEITSINEWPVVFIANFAEEFLRLPQDVLIASMQGHQKCLPVYDKHHRLLPHFIGVANIESEDQAAVIGGNEKVMRARLSDAAFFYEKDRKKSLLTYAELSKTVVFEKRLGSLADKTERVNVIAAHLAKCLNVDTIDVARAVSLSKSDLMTGLVNEFPELQGLIGYYYAQADAEKEVVAKALFEQYLPRFSGDILPETNIGYILSLADRLDTLVGIFAIGLKPNGEKDPYKLRRHALAIVRLLLQAPNQLRLSELLAIAAAQYSFLNIQDQVLADIKQFIFERLHSYFQHLDYPAETIAATLKIQSDCLFDFSLRLAAYKDFKHHEQSALLLQSAKRIGQILAQASIFGDVIPQLLAESAEQQLWHAMQEQAIKLEKNLSDKNYPQAFTHLLALSQPLSKFFEEVFVMAEDLALRQNRLNLLHTLQTQLQSIVALSR